MRRDCLYRVLPRHELHNDLCEVLVSKSLGCFCLLSSREQEITNQLRAYKATLLTSLEQMQTAATALQQLQHEVQLLQLHRSHHSALEQRLRAQLQQLLEQQPTEEQNSKRQQAHLQQQIEKAQAAAAEATEKLHDATVQSKQIVTASEAATKRLQSFALRVLMKLLLLSLAQEKQNGDEREDAEKAQLIFGERLEILLEFLYLQPVLQNQYREHVKYIMSPTLGGLSPEDKSFVSCCLSLCLSPSLPGGGPEKSIVDGMRKASGPLISKRLALKAAEGALRRIEAAAAAAAAVPLAGVVKSEPSAAQSICKQRRAEALHASLKEANDAVLLQQREQQSNLVCMHESLQLLCRFLTC
ncbi:hypothetical protein cyc_09005 [Cyclospora cayetanensis]|uniref:Uncharacterized protein n=1 Tax=Cyclospora cayetanensis TaxID=88456 RepID=A0A1D3D5N3_9EIME|nr:hypothetical protein cyc_09005 [Cyclospora cayetanensis]